MYLNTPACGKLLQFVTAFAVVAAVAVVVVIVVVICVVFTSTIVVDSANEGFHLELLVHQPIKNLTASAVTRNEQGGVSMYFEVQN